MNTSVDIQYTLPDLLVDFPWPRNLSEYYRECKADSSAWMESFHPLDEEGLKGFNLCDSRALSLSIWFTIQLIIIVLDLLAALVYFPREKEIIRLGCDLMNLFFLLEAYTDIADGNEAKKIRDIVMDAFKNPHKEKPAGELPLGAIARNVWIRASNYVSPDAYCLKHFIHELDVSTMALVKEAEDRSQRLYRTFEDYIPLRRSTSGCLPSFALCEFRLDLPEEAYHHPRMAALREQATELIASSNDLFSYAVEKARGLEFHNSVELVMIEQNMDVQGAINWLERYVAGVHAGFLDNVANMPSWGEDVDRRVKIYIDGIAQWVRGNDDWTFESGRYFGSKGLEIQKSRVMTLQLVADSKDCAKKSV